MTKLVLLFVCVNFSVYCQTIKGLEYELSVFERGETYKDKIETARQLLELDPFNERAIRFTLDYYQEKRLDSISKYFDNLASRYPEDPEPLLLRSKLLFYEHDYKNHKEYTIWKLLYLNKALTIDSLNTKTLYHLAQSYYKDFIYPFEKQTNALFAFESSAENDTLLGRRQEESRVSVFKHSAVSALHFFYKLWKIDIAQRDMIFFPIRQLECFLKREASPIVDNVEALNENCYFPFWYFANLQENWECDFTKDYLFEIEMSKFGSDNLKLQLMGLNEPCLYNANIAKNKEIYRFTWLRSFDNPISLRLEKSGQKVKLYWKVGKGAGGYEPRGIKKAGEKKIKFSQWVEFITLLKESEFQGLPNDKYVPMNDGASWTLEYKSDNSFKAHNTNWPDGKFKESCLYLLNQSRLKVKEKDIY